MKIITVDNELDNIRLDKYLIDILKVTRSKIQKMIVDNKIVVNDNKIKNSYIVRCDDIIKIDDNITEDFDIKAENIDLDIIYEDDDVVVINKPSGMVVHPAVGNYTHTLVNALMYHFNNLSTINGNIRPGIVHRIDKDTSGLLLIAKKDNAHVALSKELSLNKTKRIYLALVWGVINNETGTIDAPIGRDLTDRKKMSVTDVNSKEAITHFKVLKRYENTTLIECNLETGRTHQIRVHMNYIGYPIVNDPVYGRRKMIDDDFGQLLHAKKIGFTHPTTNKYMEFEVDAPKRFYEIIDLVNNDK